MAQPPEKDFVFGLHPVAEAIDSGKEVEKLMVQKKLRSDQANEVIGKARKRNIQIQYVPVEKLNRITRKNHQGVIAFVSPVTFHQIEQLLPTIYEKGETPLFLILDRITDVGNFGAITRTAECAGVHAVIIPTRNSARINSQTIKTSAGALFNIPICKEENLKSTIEFLSESGLQIVACTEKTETEYTEADFKMPTAIIMGSEEDGISPEYLKRSDKAVKLPMRGKTASLNVSVSTGIVLYEVLRQRG